MEEVFESDAVAVPKVKKPRKKRVVSEETKTRLRAQLKKGRETARLNRLKKKNAKAGKKTESKVVESKEVDSTPEPVIKEKVKVVEKVAVVEKPKEIVKPIEKEKPKEKPLPPPKVKEPMVVNKPIFKPSSPINIPKPEPLPYQTTYRKSRRKW